MKTPMIIAAAAILAGCASTPSQQYGYGYGAPKDPSQWRVVSVTPVPAGTGDRVAARTGSRVEYSSGPVTTSSPVYVQDPIYAPGPLYAPYPSYYYPPVSLSLGFMFGRHWSSGGHRHRGHGGRRHR